MAKMSDERSRDQRKPVEFDEVLLGILHRLDDGTSERKVAYDHLLAIENEMKRRGSRGGFARYLVAICFGVVATLAWQSYGEVPKQIIAAKAPQLGWSPETKQMIASWVQPGPESACRSLQRPGAGASDSGGSRRVGANRGPARRQSRSDGAPDRYATELQPGNPCLQPRNP